MLSRRSLIGIAFSAAIHGWNMPEVGAAQRAIRAERRRIERGILRPNPGSFRLATLRAVMDSPPTVTVGSQNGATVIADSVLVPWDDAQFRYLGGRAVVAGASFPDTTLARYNQITSNANPANMRVEFMHDGAEFEFLVKALASERYRVIVNGEPATATAQTLGGTTGSLYLVHVAFGSRDIRHIEIDGAIMYFGGVRIGPNDALWTPDVAVGPRVIFFGDSYTEGTGAGMPSMGLAQTTGTLLGWRDLWISGVGGTGYLNDAGVVGKTTFRDRVEADVIAYDPAIVIVAGGLNDHSAGSTGAEVGAEAGRLFTEIIESVPGVTLIATGPWNNSGNAPTNRFVEIRDAIHAALVESGGHLFVDNIGGPEPMESNLNLYVDQGWITGTGNRTTPTGSGNADLYIGNGGADVGHPSQAGHDFLGQKLASDISAWVEAGSPTGAKVLHGVVTPAD